MNSSTVPVLEIAQSHMCMGCGACAYACPDKLQMQDTQNLARRPMLVRESSVKTTDLSQAAAICPGIQWPENPPCPSEGHPELYDEWGPILEIWEGHSTDDEIRFKGSSGGVVTGLALACIETGGMAGALHVKARLDAPLLNETVLSCDRQSLLEGAGSRYSPASPCEELAQIEQADGPCVFIGKPCDVAAVAKARAVRPELDEKLGLTISIFCAGTPSIQGTVELARKLGAIDPRQIEEVRYRGHGWPGEITATWTRESGERVTRSISYEAGWGQTLQKYRQWRCHVCADHTGENADISVGDPWYRPVQTGEPGRSLVIVRTERGRQQIRRAMAYGYLDLEPREPWVLAASQQHLLRTRSSIWGRTWAARIVGVAAPVHQGFNLFRAWMSNLSLKEKVQSITGTIARVFRRRLRDSETPVPVISALVSTDSPQTRAEEDSRIVRKPEAVPTTV